MKRFVRANAAVLVAALVIAVVVVLGAQFLMGLPAPITIGLVVLVSLATWGVYRLLSRRPLRADESMRWWRLLPAFGIGVVVVMLAIQAVPFGRNRVDAAVTAEPNWDSPATRELVRRACFDCHSNEVHYPWYASVAPFSWAVEIHVESGRDKLNYQEWDRPRGEADEAAETVREGSMPPLFYRIAHSAARLSAAEKQQLIDGLNATFGGGRGD